MKPSTLLIALPLAGFASFVLAEPIKLAPGLWETTEKVETSGSVKAGLGRFAPKMATASERQLPIGASTSKARTYKRCIKAEDLKHDNWFEREKDPTCKFNITTSTGDTFVASRQCSGKISHSDDVQIHSSDTKHWTGSVKSNVSNGKGDQTVKVELSGLWLAADCGTQK